MKPSIVLSNALLAVALVAPATAAPLICPVEQVLVCDLKTGCSEISPGAIYNKVDQELGTFTRCARQSGCDDARAVTFARRGGLVVIDFGGQDPTAVTLTERPNGNLRLTEVVIVGPEAVVISYAWCLLE